MNGHQEYDDDSSVDTPPPPPPSDGGNGDAEEERYQEQLKMFQNMAQFSADGGEDIEDDGSVEVPPPPNLAQMGNGSPEKESKGNRYGLIAICLLVLIGVILGVGFGTGAFTSDSGDSLVESPTTAPVATSPPQDSPTVSGEDVSTPPPDTRQTRFESYFAEKSSAAAGVFNDPISPEAQALQWMVDSDPLQLDPQNVQDQARLDQRFALLTIWFNSPNDWFDESNWLSEDECTWARVSCEVVTNENQRARGLQESFSAVTRIDMASNNVQGNFPADLALLENLKILDLRDNVMSGSLPTSLTSISSLAELYLNGNDFDGTLDGMDFSSLGLLEILDLANNQIGGPIPDSIWTMRFLQFLVLDNNLFTGPISTEVGNLQFMRK